VNACPPFHFIKLARIQKPFSVDFARALAAFVHLPAREGKGEGEASPSIRDFENTP